MVFHVGVHAAGTMVFRSNTLDCFRMIPRCFCRAVPTNLHLEGGLRGAEGGSRMRANVQSAVEYQNGSPIVLMMLAYARYASILRAMGGRFKCTCTFSAFH